MSGAIYAATLPEVFIWLSEFGSDLFGAAQDVLQTYKDLEEVVDWMQERRELLVRQLASIQILRPPKIKCQGVAHPKKQPCLSLGLKRKRWLRPQLRAPPFFDLCKSRRLQTNRLKVIMDVYE